MSGPLIVAVPSKGRLKEQVEEWLADCGLDLKVSGGSRGYLAALKGQASVQVRLLSAGNIAEALDAGEAHMGVTGEDLLRERGGDLDARVMLLRALGFGRADLVVAAPKSWLDVDTMADLEAVAQDSVARSGRRLRVATKYLVQTRTFFARHSVADYRITESSGATEGAPAAGAAELIVDITTTGATLAANGLKILSDGLILSSQAQLAASLTAQWTSQQLAAAEGVLRIIEARAAAHDAATVIWSGENGDSHDLVDRLVSEGAQRRPNGLLVDARDMSRVALELSAAGLGQVTVSRPDFVFDQACAPYARLKAALPKN